MRKTSFKILASLTFLAFAICTTACSKDDDNNNNVNSADSTFIVMASFSNNAEVSAGQLAASKGNADSVKMFGSMMISDHSDAQTSLDSIATFLSIITPDTPDPEHISKAAYLQTLSAYAFDTAYINAQVIDHEATIAVFQEELSHGNDRLVKDFANSHLPIIKMHLQEALDIKAQLK